MNKKRSCYVCTNYRSKMNGGRLGDWCLAHRPLATAGGQSLRYKECADYEKNKSAYDQLIDKAMYVRIMNKFEGV